MKSVRLWSSLAVACVAAMLPFPSSAVDTRWHDGTFCIRSNTVSSGPIDYTALYGVVNRSAVGATVICPFHHSSTNPGGSTWDLDMKVYDRHASENVSCTWRHKEADGDVTQSETQSTSGSGASAKPLAFTATTTTGVDFTAECYLPPASGTDYSFVTSYKFTTPD